MGNIIYAILAGLGYGAVVSGLAQSVVLTYRGSGIISLATGGVAMTSGFCYWFLRTGAPSTPFHTGYTMGAVPAIVLTIVWTVIVGLAIEFIAFRPLRTASPLAKLVSSLGVLLTLQASMLLLFGTTGETSPAILPAKGLHIISGHFPIQESQFILTAIVVVLAIALVLVYKLTRFGLATRAVSENEVNAQLAGLSANELSLTNTIAASLIAGAIGVLATTAGMMSLDTVALPLAVVPALAAALMGRMTSFGVTAAAGFAIGALDSLVDYASSQSWFPTVGGNQLPGVKDLIIFIVIAATMYFRSGALPTRGELVEQRLPEAPRANKLLAPAVVMTVVCAVAMIVLPNDFRQALINTMIGTIMALSLVVVTGFIGQISVVQLALAGAAGFVVSHFATDLGVPFPLSPICGLIAAVLLGELTAISALRVRGVSLVVVTLAAAVAIENFGFQNNTWGGGYSGSPVPDIHVFGLNLSPNSTFHIGDSLPPSPAFGWVVLAICVALCLLVASIRRGTLGQRMLAVRSNERAAAASGVDVRRVKLVAFGVAALIAGIGGTLYGYNLGSVASDRFSTLTALSLIAFAYAGGITVVSGAIFAGLISTEGLLPHVFDKWLGINGNWFLLFGGVILLFTLIRQPAGAAGDIVLKLRARQRARARAAVQAADRAQA